MKLYKFYVCICVFSALIFSQTNAVPDQNAAETLIRVKVANIGEAQRLADLGLIIETGIVKNGVAEGFVSSNALAKIQDAGFTVTVIEPLLPLKVLYTFDDVVKLFSEWKKSYPQLTKFDTAGFSIGKKPILRFTISGTSGTAVRQRIHMCGSTHGNEKIGNETCMRIALELLQKYSSDQTIKALVDRSELVILPILNVDGFTYSSQGRRTLNNGKDPNRAFGWKLAGKDSDGSLPCQWPEMKTYLRIMVEAPCYLSIDYHAGMKATLTPFFASVTGGVLDADAYTKIKQVYPAMSSAERWETVYILESRGGGISCDQSYGKCGNIHLLPEECDHYPPESQIETITAFHMDKFFKVVAEMQKGVSGTIKDAKTGAPVYGRVQVAGKGAATCSDPRSGAFYKYIPAPSGTFDVKIFANGYKPETKSVQANATGFTTADFSLTPDTTLKFAGLSVDVIGIGNEISQSDIYSCLELHDNKGATINNGFIILDFGAKTPVSDRDGNDLTVYATNTAAYSVSVSDDPDKIVDGGTKIGDGSGVKSFDLKTAGIPSARFVRIDAGSSASPVIDAVEAEPRPLPTAIDQHGGASQNREKLLTAWYAPGGGIQFSAIIPAGEYTIAVFDVRGKSVVTLAQGYAKSPKTRVFSWNGADMNNRFCAPGAYLLHISSAKGNATVKIPQVR